MQLYTEKELVSFGNHIIEKYFDGKADGVTHADIENWKEEQPPKIGADPLPSAHQYGDIVIVNLLNAGSFPVKIINVKFINEGRGVTYDVEVPLGKTPEGEDCFTRIYNIDTVFISATIPAQPILQETV
jgi:hypothetical protein